MAHPSPGPLYPPYHHLLAIRISRRYLPWSCRIFPQDSLHFPYVYEGSFGRQRGMGFTAWVCSPRHPHKTILVARDLFLLLSNLITNPSSPISRFLLSITASKALFRLLCRWSDRLMSVGGKKTPGQDLSDKIGREITLTIGIDLFHPQHDPTHPVQCIPPPQRDDFFALFFALGYAVTATHPPLITVDIFGGQAFGRIFGSLMIFIGIGGAFGAWFTGFIFDLTGSYVPAFVVLILCAVFACFNIWSAAPGKIRRVPGKAK